VAGALAGLVLLSPIFLLVAAFIKCVSQGPIFFSQQRIGYRGQAFQMLKFRTMSVSRDPSDHQRYVMSLARSNQNLTKLDQKDALIPGAKWLRKLAIDELPQLLNVLRGDMSLVGPRPDVVPLEVYEPWQRERFDALPGLTGLWQVCGKNRTTFDQMMRLDIDYVRRISLGLDLYILLRTGPAILRELSVHAND
jgi:lipopolysaccharide/colanic/teichoic acid biosynthesis glycosyltransferase